MEFNETFKKNNSDNPTQTVDLYIERHSTFVLLCFAVVGTLSMLSSLFAVTSLCRTRKIPENAKFLSTALLVFDSMFVSFSTVRKFIQEPTANTNLNVAATTSLQLAYLTVGIMALERFGVFIRPMKYIQFVTKKRVKIGAFISWTILVVTFWLVRYGACYLQYESMLVFSQAGVCNMVVTVYYAGLVLLVLCTSMVCYTAIFRIVQEKSSANNNRKLSFGSALSALKSFRTTSLVLVYIFVILSTSIAYALIILFIRFKNLDIDTLRMSLELVSLMNCILDPFLYVLWFRESQMEMLKMMACCSPRIKKKVEAMRVEIFDIVTYSISSSSSSYSTLYCPSSPFPSFHPTGLSSITE